MKLGIMKLFLLSALLVVVNGSLIQPFLSKVQIGHKPRVPDGAVPHASTAEETTDKPHEAPTKAPETQSSNVTGSVNQTSAPLTDWSEGQKDPVSTSTAGNHKNVETTTASKEHSSTEAGEASTTVKAS